MRTSWSDTDGSGTHRPPRFQDAWELIEKAGRDPREFPAVGISHALATDYADSVGGKLPTEAQWEFAARSRGQPRRYRLGSNEKPSRRIANIDSLGDRRKPDHAARSARFRRTRPSRGSST